jgi:hypothetical protein
MDPLSPLINTLILKQISLRGVEVFDIITNGGPVNKAGLQ